jgi:putative thiazole/oxazole-modified microcin (TOMM)-like peptide
MVNGTDIPIELDWRFAELVVRTWMEPELGRRYAVDPVAVLAEFGLTVADAALAPRLEAIPEAELVIEDFDSREADLARMTLCSPPCTKDVSRLSGAVAAVAWSN